MYSFFLFLFLLANIYFPKIWDIFWTATKNDFPRSVGRTYLFTYLLNGAESFLRS
jgi:hypothetical protein